MSIIKIVSQLNKLNPSLNKSETSKIVNIFLKNITFSLGKGRSVELRDFGRFHCKELMERHNVRNPKTNELIYKPKRVRLKFKAFNYLKKLINQ